MKKALQSKKNNWLLYSGLICMAISLVLSLVIQENNDFISSRKEIYKFESLTVFVVGCLLIAPIFEELSFRSFFTNKKWLMIIGSILLPCFIYSTANNYLGWFSLVLLCLVFLWNYRVPSKLSGVLLILVSSVLFAFIHYKSSDFQSISTYEGIGYKVSLSFVAVWVTQNFGLAKSMLLHAFNNSIIVLLIILSAQFPDTSKQTYEDSNMVVTWNRVPRFNSPKPEFTISVEKMVAKNCPSSVLYLELLESKDSMGVPAEPFMNYNFNVKAKNKNTDLVNNPQFLKQFAIKNKLLILMKKN